MGSRPTPQPVRAAPLIVASVLALLGPALASRATPPTDGSMRFVDVGPDSGVDFRHHHGGRGEKHLPETMGSGMAWLDYDGDGLWDLYFVDSGRLVDGGSPGEPSGSPPTGANRLYRAVGPGRFVAAPAAALDDRGYGMGTAVADFDGDGYDDVYVTNFGPNALYRNNGDGTFETVADAGVADPRWSTSAGWGDLDGDGLVDLYVTNYVGYDPANAPRCGRPDEGVRSYCHIELFAGSPDSLYRNLGNGRFRDVAESTGVADPAGKGLGVAMTDLDDDGLLDVYVANDTVQNFLYRNRGAWRFDEVGLVSGVGYSRDGDAQAGMGVDTGDVDGDRDLDVVVTNFAFEANNLYRRLEPGAYFDDTFLLGTGETSLPRLGFGVALVDLDLDADLDLAIANGHILDNVERLKDNTTYAQANQVFRNRLDPLAARDDPRVRDDDRPERLFVDVSSEAGSAWRRARVSRGLGVGDLNGDGWPDLVVTNSDGPATVLHNVTHGSGPAASRLVLRLRGRRANRDAVGARLWITPLSEAGEPLVSSPLVRELEGASSYLTDSADDLYVGLEDAAAARIEVRWPGGGRETIGRLAAGDLYLVHEGRGVVARRSLRSPSARTGEPDARVGESDPPWR